MKLEENDLEILEKVSKITFTDYEIKKFEKEGYIDPYQLIRALEDMLYEYDNLQEKIDNVNRALQNEGLQYLRW